MEDRFRINTDDYLSFNYEAYRNNLYALALTKPSEYFELRSKVLQGVKQRAVGNIYNTFYDVLSKGEIGEDSSLLGRIRDGGPSYPQQEVTKISLKAARTMDDILNEVIEIILPQDYKSLANLSMITKTKADAIN